MDVLDKLKKMRTNAGKPDCQGLSDDKIREFAASDPRLAAVISEALEIQSELQREFGSQIKTDEKKLLSELQQGYVNFYETAAINPFIPIAARGPWIVTICGSVVHDSGGYGMLGMGHNFPPLLKTLAKPQVMANIMTGNFAQKRLVQKLHAEIGHRRSADKRTPYSHFLCLNSGSEAITVASRLSDTRARALTEKGARHHGKKIRFLACKGGFHGRTERPAQASDSSAKYYRKHLATFRDQEFLITVIPNDLDSLRAAFAKADQEGVFFEAMFFEPVMSEGDPGKGTTPEFYKLARELTSKNDTLLIADSIQAGLRAHGCLSIVDYPGFEDLLPPDMEAYSKALNGGQFPLSVLAVTQSVAEVYVKGTYGNTMTTNPRALDIASTMLDALTPELRRNIQDRGREFLAGFKRLKDEFPGVITGYQGTGLLCSLAVDGSKIRVVGFDGIETRLRKRGISVIHGGENSLRFTPVFDISSAEVNLIIDQIGATIRNWDKESA